MNCRIIQYILIFIFTILVVSSCERFPRDPENTLQKVRNDILLVGITENPPYVIFEEKGPAGIEINMIEALAKHLKAEVKWVKGSEETIITLLKEGQVHICAGGFSHSSLWKKHIYLLSPHDTIIYGWGVPPSLSLPEDIKKRKVYVQRGSVAGAYIQKKGGIPVYMDSITGSEPLIVSTTEKLREWNCTISGKVLKRKKVSLAGRKGENAFIEEVEKFLTDYKNKNVYDSQGQTKIKGTDERKGEK